MSDTMTEAGELLSALERLSGRTITKSRRDKERMVGLIFSRFIIARRSAYERGRNEFKVQVMSSLQGCLDRDPTLQKLARSIEEMD